MEKCIIDIKNIKFDKGIFDSVVDCTYVLLCCGPKPYREDSVYKNLKILQPSSVVKLIYNSGYKNCCETKSPMDDMATAQLYIFKDALKHNYKRILWLEDDFFLPNHISNFDINLIISFIKNNDPSVYGLGNFIIPSPKTLLSYHQSPLFNLIPLTHAMIYNNIYMKKAIQYYEKNDIKMFQDSLPYYLKDISIYRYYKPLIYQTFPETDNQKNGWELNRAPITKIIMKFAPNLVKLVKLDKDISPGYEIIYYGVYILYFIIILIIFLVLYYYLMKYKNNIKWNL